MREVRCIYHQCPNHHGCLLPPQVRLGDVLRSIPPLRVRALLEGVDQVREAFTYWTTDDCNGVADAPSMLSNSRAVPSGGAARRVLLDLERLSQHSHVVECKEELKKVSRHDSVDDRRAIC